LSVIGEAVRNSSGERLGRIDDLLVDASSGDVLFAILATGGFGRAEKDLRAVPWRVIQADPIEQSYRIDVERHEFEKVPSFSRDERPDFSDPVILNDAMERFGEFV
jgi:hypothetical protein